MNEYELVFPFKGKYEYVYVTANQLANELLPSNDNYTDFQLDNSGQYFSHKFVRHTKKSKKEYTATFSINNPYKIAIYDDSLEMDALVEEVPWVCLSIRNGETEETLFNITDGDE